MPDRTVEEQIAEALIAEALGAPLDGTVVDDVPDERELHGGEAHEQPAATGELSVKIIKRVND